MHIDLTTIDTDLDVPTEIRSPSTDRTHEWSDIDVSGNVQFQFGQCWCSENGPIDRLMRSLFKRLRMFTMGTLEFLEFLSRRRWEVV
jgi:hypothetical protein